MAYLTQDIRKYGFVALFIWSLLLQITIASTICEISPSGYYIPPTPGGTRLPGLPSATAQYKFITKPPSLSCAELAQAQRTCVDMINQYRSGAKVFSNGSSDPTLGSPPPLIHTPPMDKCHSETVMGDFAFMGACANGAHKNAFSCKGYSRGLGQNLCCPRTIQNTDTLASLLQKLSSCLQVMWDEGQDPYTGQSGHWLNMKKASYLYASCGFAFATNADATYVLMSQNFGVEYSAPPVVTSHPTTASAIDASQSDLLTKSPTRLPTYRRKRRGLRTSIEV